MNSSQLLTVFISPGTSRVSKDNLGTGIYPLCMYRWPIIEKGYNVSNPCAICCAMPCHLLNHCLPWKLDSDPQFPEKTILKTPVLVFHGVLLFWGSNFLMILNLSFGKSWPWNVSSPSPREGPIPTDQPSSFLTHGSGAVRPCCPPCRLCRNAHQ